jgi:biopolymer transport protein ExbD
VAEETEEQASMAQVKSLIRRKLRRIEPVEEQSLNIYPLMDVMTILLVFMVMQFAQDAAAVVESPDLQIPYSTSRTELQQSVPVQISRTDITVEGRPVLTLRNGLVDPSQKQGGGTGFLITPLHSVMNQHRDRLRAIERGSNGRRPFTGAVQIIADKRTPYRTLSEVMYTVGQAEFANIHFVVLQNSASNR